MSKEVAIKEKDARKILADAKDCFRKMQESWFYFGKAIHAIYHGEVYRAVDPDMAFKDFCEAEYTSIGYKNIMKIISVVEEHGTAIEARIKKDAAYRIPPYEDCYQVVVASNKDEFPKEEASKLKKDVLDGKIFNKELRERFKKILSEHSVKTKEEVEASARDIEKKLIKDLEGEDLDGFYEEDFDDDADESEIETEELEDVEDDRDSDLKSAIAATQARVDYLNDNLRELLKRVEADGPSDEVTELCERMDKLYANIDKFLTKYEQINE